MLQFACKYSGCRFQDTTEQKMMDTEIQPAFTEQNILNDLFFHTKQHIMDPMCRKLSESRYIPHLKALLVPEASASTGGSCPVIDASFSAHLFH